MERLNDSFQSCPPFYERLRAVMKEKGVSTYQLINTAPFSSRHLYNWSHGTDPQLSTLLDLAELMDCSLDYLVGREN